MVLKEYFTLPRSPKKESHRQMQFSHIEDTTLLVWVLPLRRRDSVRQVSLRRRRKKRKSRKRRMDNDEKVLNLKLRLFIMAQSAGAAEYANCICLCLPPERT